MKLRITKFRAICFILLISVSFFGCKKTLTPARNLEGTWNTPFAVTIYMKSDGCGTFTRYNRTPVKMTWTITYIDDTNVDITIAASYIGTTTQTGSNCGAPATLNFPLYLHGRISSSNLKLLESQMQYNNSGGAIGLALVEVGNFNFTTNNITGTINEKDCPIYCAGYDTDANTCILTK